MRRLLFPVAAVAVVLAAPCLAESISDATFVTKAAVSDMFEIQAGELAEGKATNADAKSFATRMVADHTKSSDQLKSILASKPRLTLPSAMDAKHKMLLNRLKSASAATFDRLYATQLTQAHQQAVTLFTSESQGGQDADLKKFAADTLPTIKDHLAMAEKLPKSGGTP